MKKEIEKIIFEKTWDRFDGTYFLSHVSSQGWPSFFMVEGDHVLVCKAQKIGWCMDGPGEVTEKLEHIVASLDQASTLTLTFEGESKQLLCKQGSVTHYYGR